MRATYVICVCLAALPGTGIVFAADAGNATASRTTQTIPQALFIAFEQYGELPLLERPITSASRLARALHKHGYGITVITSRNSQLKLIGALSGLDGITVGEADTPADLTAGIENWRKRYFESKQTVAPFGICVFVGHGEHRRSAKAARDFLLTPDDNRGEGGLCIQDVADTFGSRYLPVVFVVDMCRSLSSGKPADDHTGNAPVAVSPNKRKQEGPNSSGFDSLVKPDSGRTSGIVPGKSISPVFTLWGTQVGKVAYDDGNLTTALAEGLEEVEDGYVARAFRIAGPRSPAASFAPVEGAQDLSLFTWFSYAAWYVFEANKQAVECATGLVDPTMICASRRSSFDHVSPPLDLLSQWRQFTPSTLKITQTAEGVEFHRPPSNDRGTSLFTVSFLSQSHSWKGKTLMIQAMAKNPSQENTPVGCLLMPGNNANGTVLRSDWSTKVFYVPCDAPRWFSLPLEGEETQKFLSVGVSVPAHDLSLWPENATVRILQMQLIDQDLVDKFIAAAGAVGRMTGKAAETKQETVELLPRWWAIEMPADNESSVVATKFARSVSDQSRLLTLTFTNNKSGTAAGRGGSIFRPPYVDKDRMLLRVSVNSIKATVEGDAKSRAEIIIKDELGNLVVCPLSVPSGSKQYYLKFARSGFPEQIYIMATDVSEISLSNVSIVPK
jgi:hypothetical protein